jgi:uncharacterized membrane protein YdjX (TVP38/TMEM64 family)
LETSVRFSGEAGSGLSRWRALLGWGALLLALGAAGRLLHTELEIVGHWFAATFGLWGIALGVFLADAVHFPIPAQFYMLLSITGGYSDVIGVLTIYAGSLLGGVTGYNIGRRLTRIERLRARIERSGGWIAVYVNSPHVYRGVTLVSLSPFAYSVLCMACGLYHLRPRAFLIVLALRLPKIIVYYTLIRLSLG